MKRAWYLHPFLFAAYPGLNGIAFNVTQNSPLLGGRILVVSILLGAALLLVGWAFSREGHRSGFMASIFSLTILAYGHVYLLVQAAHMGPHTLGRHVGVLAAWLLIVVLLCSRWAWSRFHDSQRITLFMNVAAIAAVLLPSLKIGWSLASTAIDSVRLNDRLVTLDPGGIHLNGVARPDIYFIVLDGYGREDALRDTHGLDNSGFTGFLESRGFVVADQAQANYMQTALSLASTLNLSYMDTLASVLGPRSQDREPLVALIRGNLVRESLARQGYEFVALSSGSYFSEIRNADLYLSPFRSDLNELEGLWLSTTAAILLEEQQDLGLPFPSYDNRRRLIEYAFQALIKVSARPGPQFVFAHILAPHPPFVFTASGMAVDPPWPYHPGDGESYGGTPAGYRLGYSQEIQYVNDQMQEVVNAILEQAETPPVILIQGDHGPGALLNFGDINGTCLRERVPILSAYYLPSSGREQLYASISPVNSFRVVFNSVFDAGLQLLPDRAYFSTWSNPYAFTDVTNDTDQSCESPDSAGATPSR